MLKLPPDVSSVPGADNSGGHRRLQPEGASDRQHPVAHVHAGGIPQLHNWEIAVRLNFDYRQICLLINADHLGRVKGWFRIQLYLDLGRLLDHVIVRQYEAFFIDDNSGPQAPLRLRPLVRRIEKTVEEIMKRIGSPAPAWRLPFPINHLRCGDVHYRGFIPFDDRAKRVGQTDRVGKL